MALICETVTAATMRVLRERRDRSNAALVELRLDGVADVDVAGALEGRAKPVIVTCRSAAEGGRFDGSEEARLRILGAAFDAGAEYVDVEWRCDRRGLAVGDGRRLVLSHHDFSGVPRDLGDRASAMRREAPSGIVKIACAIEQPAELIQLREVASADGGRHVVIGMDAAGVLSRVCPAAFGSVWTYGGHAAPGQLTVDQLAHVYRVDAQTASTRTFALTGRPLEHSASPAMHNAAFVAAGIDAVYVPLESGDQRQVLAVAQAFGIEGVSVTAPLKVGWDELGVALDQTARAIGAANTLRHVNGRWEAANFDVDGFVAPLRERHVNLRGARCVVLGAGGAARAAAWALIREGARVEISARRASAAGRLAAALGVAAVAWPPATGWDLLVNATPVGTWPDVDAAPIPQSCVRGGVVYDLVYHPRSTALLGYAGEAGAAVIGGLDMLVAQAARQFEYWIGRPAPAGVMRVAAERFLDEEGAER